MSHQTKTGKVLQPSGPTYPQTEVSLSIQGRGSQLQGLHSRPFDRLLVVWATSIFIVLEIKSRILFFSFTFFLFFFKTVFSV